MRLSEAQRLAVETVGKNVCVSAGAGSGKTRVLVERFVHLVTHHGVSAREILAITFTEKAANEMKRRIVERLRAEGLEEARREVENAAIGTIHSFCARLLREHPVEAGVDPFFIILESSEAKLLAERALDEAIETLVHEKEIFDLLRVYGEGRIRVDILGAWRCSRNTNLSFEEILRRRTPAAREGLVRELRKGLREIAGTKGCDEARQELEGLLAGEALGLEEISRFTQLKKKLRAAGERKPAIQRVQEMILDLASFLHEEATLPLREVFIRLALEFEKTYEEAKRPSRALDFDDLQRGAVKLLGSDSPASRALRKIYQTRFREILVDEFQDTNRLQDQLLELIRRESNLFLVGDLKQSIYGFRGTKVEIFLEREKTFEASPCGVRISMAENYRARPKLIDFVNAFFEILWKEDAVRFEKLQAARPEEGNGARVDRIALQKVQGQSSEEVRIREARALARHIQEFVEKEGFRYRDIACLFEAMSDVHFYEQELGRLGIPYYVVSNRGFYSQPEIRDMMSFLIALENPKRDIPLASALRSPLFQVSDETLFWLARGAKRVRDTAPLMEGILELDSIPEISEGERDKVQFFKETLEHFLAHKEKLRISELVEGVLQVTDYDLYVLKLRQGERRLANLRKLVELARQMEAKDSIHLGDFVHAVKDLETLEVRESQAQVEAEEGEVVRLMSIHMAKGLEFPVVILPDLGRGEKSEGWRFLTSEEEGLGVEGSLTFRRNKQREERFRSEESKRLLYVAMTRAGERLVLIGPGGEPSSKDSFHDMPNWAAWVDRILSEGDWEVKNVIEPAAEPYPFERRKALAERSAIQRHLENLSPIPQRTLPPDVDRFLERLGVPERVYFQRIDLPVSAFLLFARDPEAYFRHYEIGIPENGEMRQGTELKTEEWKGEEEITSAEIGTRVHQILERILRRRAGIREIERIVGQFTQDLSEHLREDILGMIQRFAASPQAEEVWGGKAFYPEIPFAFRLRHGLVQGTMDLIYERQKGEWLILDYKTSEVDSKTFAARAEDYRIQLELYALAASQILRSPVREARVYFLRQDLAYSIPFAPAEFERLYEKFTALQEEILKFRREKAG